MPSTLEVVTTKPAAAWAGGSVAGISAFFMTPVCTCPLGPGDPTRTCTEADAVWPSRTGRSRASSPSRVQSMVSDGRSRSAGLAQVSAPSPPAAATVASSFT
jgi:hypothetical protein